MTNRDKIKAMDNAELAKVLNTTVCEFCIFGEKDPCGGNCLESIEAWLELECEPENPPADNKPQPADNVNHPAHYTFGQIEVIDFIEDKKLGFHLGNAVKYISRAGRKNPDKTIEDLQKAAWYLNRQIARLERELDGQNG